jgi:hypothetical protein
MKVSNPKTNIRPKPKTGNQNLKGNPNTKKGLHPSMTPKSPQHPLNTPAGKRKNYQLEAQHIQKLHNVKYETAIKAAQLMATGMNISQALKEAGTTAREKIRSSSTDMMNSWK